MERKIYDKASKIVDTKIDIAIGKFGESLTSPLQSFFFLKFMPIFSNSITFS